jgi:tetratricopeptide (TPR) repeat protein
MNIHFLQGTFSEGVKEVAELEKQLKTYSLRLDQHRVLVLYYKIASLYFGNGNYSKTIDYLNKIINAKLGNLRADIQCFARLLQLIVHFEKGHYNLLEYLIKSVYRFIAKNEDLSGVMTEILKFLRKAMTLGRRDLRTAFIELREKLIELSHNPFERRSFIYLDIISWLDSKIDNKPIAEIIHQKFLERQMIKNS